jgi:hypothetical protein
MSTNRTVAVSGMDNLIVSFNGNNSVDDPPNSQLTLAKREGLYKCLMQEYFDFDAMTGSLIDWLKTNSPTSEHVAVKLKVAPQKEDLQ